MLFLTPCESDTYLEGTITAPVTTPQSYFMEAQERTYHQTQQHICPINSDIPSPFTRPDMHQDSPFHDPICTKIAPSQDCLKPTKQSIAADQHQQQTPAKSSQPSCIPKSQPSNRPENCPSVTFAASCPASTSCIPKHHHSPYSRPPTILCHLIPRPSTTFCSPIPRPSTKLQSTIDQYLAHLTAINGQQPTVHQ